MLIGVVSFLFIFERPIDRTVEESGDNSAPPVVTSPFDEPEETTQTMKISSTAFENNAEIPSKYSCDGDDITPPLQISDIPENTESLVIISDDPEASSGTWIHWLVWNIDPATTEIAEDTVPSGAVEGTTSFENTGYGGPCPPSGEHKYFFKLYALDTTLDLTSEAGFEDLETAMEGHILESTELIGLYSRD